MSTTQAPTVRTSTQTAGFDRYGIVEDIETRGLLRGEDQETFHYRRRTITETRHPDGSSRTHRSPWEEYTPEPSRRRPELFSTDPAVWVDRERVEHRIADMDPGYAGRAAAFLRRRAGTVLVSAYNRASLDAALHDGGDMAHAALESEASRLHDLVVRAADDPSVALAWLEEAYTGKLAALDARAQETDQ